MRYVDGTISRLTGQRATVEVKINEGGCGRCHEVGGCGSQNISRAFCQKTKSIDVSNTLGLAVGDMVRVGIEERTIGAAATKIYVIPLIGILFGAGLGQFFMGSQASIIGAFSGLAIALVYSKAARFRSLPDPILVKPSVGGSQQQNNIS